MMDMIVFCILFFIIIESLKESGALDSISNGLLKLCKGIRSVQFIIMIASVFGTIVTAGSSTGITFVGPMANKNCKEVWNCGHSFGKSVRRYSLRNLWIRSVLYTLFAFVEHGG